MVICGGDISGPIFHIATNIFSGLAVKRWAVQCNFSVPLEKRLFPYCSIVAVTGHLPQNIVGTAFTDYVHDEDSSYVSRLLTEGERYCYASFLLQRSARRDVTLTMM